MQCHWCGGTGQVYGGMPCTCASRMSLMARVTEKVNKTRRSVKWWIFRKVYCWVNLYEVERAWGGPEEGGWWYDYGEPVKSVLVLRGSMDRRVTRELEDRAKILKDDRFSRFSAAGGTDYEVYHEPHPGRPFPKEVPHYE